MTIVVSTDDRRSLKALALLEGAGTWQKGRTRGGRSFYAVPSQSAAGLLHMADTRACSCLDYRERRQPCKHVLAVRLHVARLNLGAGSPPDAAPRHTADQIAAGSALYAELFSEEG
jgi:hypothetical protein